MAPVGIVQSDAGGRAVFVNERWCALTGWPVARAVGVNWLDLLRPTDRARIEQKMSAQGQPEIAFDTRLRRADGTEVAVRGSVVALRRAGRPAGTLATFTEISQASAGPKKTCSARTGCGSWTSSSATPTGCCGWWATCCC
jgi:PAS domain S-box-containing protein